MPLESSNVDLSLEWYFDEASYISTGFFQKNVAKFIGSKQVDSGHFGILDVTGGARAKAAAQAVIDGGWALDDSSLYNMMVLLEHPEVFPNGAADYDGSDAQAAQLAETPGWDLTAVAGDPEMIFRTNTPDNNKEAKIYGAEFAVQHFFGDTGFGVQANYTLVRGDIKFDNEADPDVSQFALIGLSDTANVVAMYEKDGWQARIAYNWRDEYLAEVNKGSSNNPRYVEAYSQIDLNVSYEVNDDLTVFFEGINLTEENSRSHARNKTQLWYLTELGARYQVGARYSF
ncbi:TonB-dependent receptor domain-containing protein [Psychrosphaera algicola]|uniref:TonB-dependent receptor n=1 Tax=Psychrosphaera algicola TaxID=3023714 RepID=A0ABT5FIP4_9GAMM|nr:TonB-dependent receptor [Psychrosphaera sp. G1-22]MDC2891067.1 TonB-dependent receptor [Psychrosphaera sp. G1-22]